MTESRRGNGGAVPERRVGGSGSAGGADTRVGRPLGGMPSCLPMHLSWVYRYVSHGHKESNKRSIPCVLDGLRNPG